MVYRTRLSQQLLWGLGQADVIKISDEEVEFLFGLNPDEGAQYIIEHFETKLVFVTCGAQGRYFRNARSNGFVPALNNVCVKGTTGAGDIFGGSAVWMLFQTGKSPETLTEDELRYITRFACTSASLSTTKSGGIPSIPDLNCIIQELSQQETNYICQTLGRP